MPVCARVSPLARRRRRARRRPASSRRRVADRSGRTSARSTLVRPRPTPRSPSRRGRSAAPSNAPVSNGSLAASSSSGSSRQHDAEVVLGLGEQAVGVDQLEPVAGLQRVPLVHVTVDEHRSLVVVGVEATLRAGDRVIDHGLRARVIEGLPRRGDVVDQPGGLRRHPMGRPQSGAGRQMRCAASHKRREPFVVRQCELRHRRPEPFQQQGVTGRVVPQQQSGSRRRRPTGARRPRGRRAHLDRGMRSLSTAGVPSSITTAATNASVPSSNAVPTSMPQSRSSDVDEVREVVDPLCRPDRDRPVAHDVGKRHHGGEVTSGV